jgi:transcriptional regulator GlxA family with amidase domain
MTDSVVELIARPMTRPRTVTFLLIDGFALISYSSAVEPLRAANLLSPHRLYDIQHLVSSGGHAVSSSGAIIEATRLFDDESEFDDLFVVAGGDPVSFNDERVMRWLRSISKRDVRLGGISGGSVILALAGVMTGRRMTVHWEHAETLLEVSPELLIERSLYVIDRDRLTCAGGIAPMDMMHALLIEQHGSVFAHRVSDWFMHTDIRPSGGPQRAGLAERYRISSLPLLNAIEAMENHVADPLDLQQLSSLAGVGKRQLNRLFRQQFDLSAMTFYRNLRLEKARNLLMHSPLSITAIALATGFASSAHFSTAFRGIYGDAPSRIRSTNRAENVTD